MSYKGKQVYSIIKRSITKFGHTQEMRDYARAALRQKFGEDSVEGMDEYILIAFEELDDWEP